MYMYGITVMMLGIILFASLSVLEGNNANIIYSPAGIDFGSLFVKVAHVAPNQGNPVPLALNEMSERKTINSIAVKDEHVLIGTQASKWFLNKPEFAYRWVSLLLGARDGLENELNGGLDETGRFLIENKSFENQVHPEFISGLFLHKLMRQVERDTKKSLREVVITVPPYFDLVQKYAITQVAKLANLKVLSLMNDISAAGLYYATFIASKQSDELRKFVLLDLGASHSAAAIFSFDPDFKKESFTFLKVQMLQISSRKLGGRDLDQVLSNLIMERKRISDPNFSSNDLKIKNRILAEANRIKHVLSANNEARVNLDDLRDDFSFSCVLSRTEFEDRIKEWADIPLQLVDDIFTSTNISSNDVSAIIPIGGNSRVPLVKAALESKYGDKVKFILNADESVAQGAAWYSAMLSNFRIKKILFEDVIQNNISLEYLKDGSPTRITIFEKNTAAGHEKIVTFKNLSLFEGTIYLDQTPILTITSEANIDDVIKSKGIQDATYKIKMWILVDNSGFVSIPRSPQVLYEYLRIPARNLNANSTDSDKINENSEIVKNGTGTEDIPISVSESFELKVKVVNLVPILSESVLKSYTHQIKSLQLKEDHEKIVSQTINDLETIYYRMKGESDEAKDFLSEKELSELEMNLTLAKSYSDGDKDNYEEAKRLLRDLSTFENNITGRRESLSKLQAAKEEILSLLKIVENDAQFDKAAEIRSSIMHSMEDISALDENTEKLLQYKLLLESELRSKLEAVSTVDGSVKSNTTEEKLEL